LLYDKKDRSSIDPEGEVAIGAVGLEDNLSMSEEAASIEDTSTDQVQEIRKRGRRLCQFKGDNPVMDLENIRCGDPHRRWKNSDGKYDPWLDQDDAFKATKKIVVAVPLRQ